MNFRTFALGAVLATGAFLVAAAAAGAQLEQATVAPANEYFGQIRLSIIGIRSTINNLRAAASDQTLSADSLRARVALLQDAIIDWEHKYPHDPGIARYRKDLATLTTRISLAS